MKALFIKIFKGVEYNMERIEIMNSIALKKRFCKDCNIPITVFDNPYFYERLCALDIEFGCVDKFEDFCWELKKFNNEQDYFEYYNKVKEEVIEYIKNNKKFIEFSNENIQINPKYPKRNLYIEENNDRTFISLDMKKANFSALHYYSPSIFKDCSSWEAFMRTFTDCEHIINSKYIRQVIMGACNPKKQITYEKFLMNELVKELAKEIETLYVFSLGEDEIILYTEDCGYTMSKFYRVLENNPIGEYIRLTMFDLYKIKGTDGWMKYIYDFDNEPESDDKVEFKCLNAEIYHQIVKHYYNEVITPNDLVFYHNGQLAAFLKEVDNPWGT